MEIDNNKITFKTFEKELNPHQYIPAHSAHPKASLKGLIFGAVHRYFQQNTKKSDFDNICREFHEHIRRCGYTRQQIDPLFIEAGSKLNTKPTCNSIKQNIALKQPVNVYFHEEYHPRGLSKRQIHDSIQTTCAPFFNNSIENEQGKKVQHQPSSHLLLAP